MKKGTQTTIIMLLIISVSGCYYDKAELLYPTNPQGCDTTVVRYSVEVVNILSTNCDVCHGGAATGSGGIMLDNYAGLKARASNGLLLKAITHSAGAPPMPQDGPKLADCDILKISAWINRGAPNNYPTYTNLKQ